MSEKRIITCDNPQCDNETWDGSIPWQIMDGATQYRLYHLPDIMGCRDKYDFCSLKCLRTFVEQIDRKEDKPDA